MNQLNLCAPIGYTGYGVAGFNIAKELVYLDCDIALFARDELVRQDRQEKSLIYMLCERSKQFFYDAPCLNIWHQDNLSTSIGKGKYVAFPFFELNRFNDKEIHNLKYPDEIVVASSWAKDVLIDNIPDLNVSIVPLGVDRNIFNENNNKRLDQTIFLNCGKWEVRKGHDLLIEIFNEAFDVDDNVQLWMIPTNVHISQEDQLAWENLYINSKMGKAGKVKILPWQRTHNDIAKIMSKVDCGVFLSRAEGWNLELLEMMSMGKEVITTNYSAHTEFCNNQNAHLLDIQDLEPAYDGIWFNNQGEWASITDNHIEQTISYMQDVHNRKQSGESMINQHGIQTAIDFSWLNSAKSMKKILFDTGEQEG